MIATLFDQGEDVTPPVKSNEWYTPAKYIEAARTVMGSIDLDPASCEMANRTVKATKYYSIEDDGLSKEWAGNVWLNPPYGKTDSVSNKEVWTRKLIQQYYSGNVTRAVLLVTAATENMWFQDLWQFIICFSVRNDRVRFFAPNGEMVEHAHGTAFVYLGPNESAFIDTFSQFGRIAKAIDTPRKPKHSPLSLWEAQK
jgi:phage N-6-adenine-methyltransferase